MPAPIATAAVAVIEFTMVRHWFFSLAEILGFTIFSFIIDGETLSGHGHNLFITMCRIYAKNVKLACKILWAILLLLTVIGGAVAILKPKGTPRADGGGPESEKFYRFMNTATAPLQWVTNTIRFGLGILAIIFLATLYFTYRVFAFSPAVPIATAAVIVLVYAGWLWRTTRRIVAEEFGDEVTISHAIMALVPAQLTTWFLFVVFFFATQTGWHWLIAQIPE